MTDRSADWAARRRAWEAERLGPPSSGRRSADALLDDQRHADRALYGPWSLADATRLATSAFRASRRSPAASTRPAIGAGCGRCACSPGFGAAEDTNARFRQLLAAGQTGLSIAYDMPTLYGYDTDDPEAEGEFGTCGVGGLEPGRHGGPARRACRSTASRPR